MEASFIWGAWFLSFFLLWNGLRQLAPFGRKILLQLSHRKEIANLRRSVHHLKLLEECFETGLVPEKEKWEEVSHFPAPWGEVISLSFLELRQEGAPILPSLRRMQKTLEDQVEIIQESKVKSAQALGQAILGIGIVPLFGLALFLFLPRMEEQLQSFLFLVIFSSFLSLIAFVWMLSMVENAQFANLSSGKRKWLVSANATIERILAMISTGLPPDLAWRKAIEELSKNDQELAQAWGSQVWDSVKTSFLETAEKSEAERRLKSVGQEIRKSIQTSLIEGRPCLDRMESLHRAFLTDMKMMIAKELSLLPNRCLKPLFVFVLPAVMFLMFGSFALTFKGMF